MFSVTSRYNGLAVGTYTKPDGTLVSYVRRRFVPRSDRFQVILQHIVTQGDRLDNITAQNFGDPEQFWRIADANDAIQPFALTEVIGKRLRITLPEGITGTSFA